MKAEERAELRRLVDAATPGPWLGRRAAEHPDHLLPLRPGCGVALRDPHRARRWEATRREHDVTTTTPERTEPRTHQCVCRLIFYAGTSYMRIDECNAQVGPDQGMCDPCLRDSHHLLPASRQQATIPRTEGDERETG